jgi:hypothetical protein
MRTSRILRFVCAAAVVFGTHSISSAGAEPIETCTVVDVSTSSRSEIGGIKARSAGSRWVELGDSVVICGAVPVAKLSSASATVVDVIPDVAVDDLWVARGYGRDTLEIAGWRVLAWQDGFAVVLRRAGAHVLETPGEGCRRPTMRPLTRSQVLLRSSSADPTTKATVFGSEVAARVAAVTPSRWEADVATLAAWNRNTFGSEVLLARDWLVAQFEALPGLTVTTEQFTVFSSTPAWNVVAMRTGMTLPDDWYVIGGHYDSTSENTSLAAPGAEDNASGCAGVLEMARVLTETPTAATLMFTCFAGEEQGLYGSEAQVSNLDATGDDLKVRAMLNMDMIAYTSDADLDVLLESEEFVADLVGTFEDAAAEFTDLRTVISYDAWGSDHVPYLDHGLQAVLAIENDYGSYPHYHRTTDTPDHLTTDMAIETLKMNIAVIAHLAGSDGGVLFADGFESGGMGRWSQTVN